MPTRSRPVSYSIFLTLSGRRGMTLHLLKQTAKPSKAREKRKKFAVLEFQPLNAHALDQEMEDDQVNEVTDPIYRDVTDNLRKSKRNKTAPDQT